MGWMRAASGVLVMVSLTLAGCGDDSSGSSAATAGASPEASPSTVSVSQAASVAARVKAQFADLSTSFETSCPATSDIEALGCAAVVQTAQIQGLNASRDLKAIQPPPAEVAGLITDTVAAADALGGQDVSVCESEPTDVGCAGTAVRVRFFVTRVEQALAGWEPYL